MRMRSVVVIAIAVFALLGVLSPPVFAQAPAPKVTINGLIDNVTFASKNFSMYDRDFSRGGDTMWDARTRGVFTVWGEVGKVKGALAIEFDAGWGNTDSPNSPTNASHGPAQSAYINNEFGLNNDTNFLPEVKWLFVEFPLPWIPGSTIARVGGQSDRWTYKPAVVVYTDSPGIALESTWSPAVRTRLAYFQYNEREVGHNGAAPGNSGPGATAFPRGDAWAIEASAEISPFKGLDIMPLFVYWQQGPIGTQAGSGSFGWEPNRGGMLTNVGAITQSGNPNSAACLQTGNQFAAPLSNPGAQEGAQRCHEYRWYTGVDARWKAGIFFFNPTVVYTYGARDIFQPHGGAGDAVDFHKSQKEQGVLLDMEGGVTLGPLTVPGIFMYSPGQKATTNIGNCPPGVAGCKAVQNVSYYQALYIDTSYGAGRISEIFAPNSVDYLKHFAPSTSLHQGGEIGYDRYGRLDIGVRPKYALTPTVTLGALAAAHWTDTGVDTNSTFSSATGLVPAPRGSQRLRHYLGTDLAAFLTYAFLPGLTLDLGTGILVTGTALQRCATDELPATANAAIESGGHVCTEGRRSTQNAYWGAARLRYQF